MFAQQFRQISLHLILFLVALSHTTSQGIENNEITTYHNVERIGVQVGRSGCNCDMQVTICGGTYCCITEELDSSNNDFESEDYNMFSGATLGDCGNFTFPTDVAMTTLTVFHDGLDGVDIEFWDIFYNDNTFQTCNDGNFYDNDDLHQLTCV